MVSTRTDCEAGDTQRGRERGSTLYPGGRRLVHLTRLAPLCRRRAKAALRKGFKLDETALARFDTSSPRPLGGSDIRNRGDFAAVYALRPEPALTPYEHMLQNID